MNEMTHVTIYTISTNDKWHGSGDDDCIGGSYISRGRAISELTDWVLERIGLRKDIAYTFSHDIYHKEMANAVSWGDGDELVYHKDVDKIRAYVADEIGVYGCYAISNEEEDDFFMFSLEENALEVHGDEELIDIITQLVDNAK